MAKRGSNPNLKAELIKDLSPRIQHAAEAGAAVLRENVSAGARSGVHYPNLPRRSSAAGEFPQEQEGDLRASVDANPTNNPLVWEVGFFGDDQGKLNNLEYAPPSRGGRAPLARTMSNPETLKRMEDALKK